MVKENVYRFVHIDDRLQSGGLSGVSTFRSPAEILAANPCQFISVSCGRIKHAGLMIRNSSMKA